MGGLIIVVPQTPAALTVSRGTGAENLLTPDPGEVWADEESFDPATITIDLGEVRSIDTLFLGHCYPLPLGTTWSISGGVASAAEQVLQAHATMRVVDTATRRPGRSHALWHGAVAEVRYLSIEIDQAAGFDPVTIGSLIVGRAFAPTLGREWGSGRGVADTGRATGNRSGGFAIEPGVRKGKYSWPFGDLSDAEVDELYEIQLEVGETSPLLVIEDPDRTVGQVHRIHYARFSALKEYKRRNPAQTRWEFEIEEWGATGNLPYPIGVPLIEFEGSTQSGVLGFDGSEQSGLFVEEN